MITVSVHSRSLCTVKWTESLIMGRIASADWARERRDVGNQAPTDLDPECQITLCSDPGDAGERCIQPGAAGCGATFSRRLLDTEPG